MGDGAAGRTGARVAPHVVSASGDGTGVATHPGRLHAGTTVTATTSTMTYALVPTVRVSRQISTIFTFTRIKLC